MKSFVDGNMVTAWASKNGPSRHIKFHHVFQMCCIKTNAVLKLLK